MVSVRLCLTLRSLCCRILCLRLCTIPMQAKCLTVKLFSEANTGYFYTFRKNPKTYPWRIGAFAWLPISSSGASPALALPATNDTGRRVNMMSILLRSHRPSNRPRHFKTMTATPYVFFVTDSSLGLLRRGGSS